jgi:hypothetical protein
MLKEEDPKDSLNVKPRLEKYWEFKLFFFVQANHSPREAGSLSHSFLLESEAGWPLVKHIFDPAWREYFPNRQSQTQIGPCDIPRTAVLSEPPLPMILFQPPVPNPDWAM